MEHEKLLAATRDTRSVVNTIFDFLLKEVNDKDIYELSNPEKCRKYIVTMAGTLDSIFYQIRLEPTRGKEGFIFFRAAKDVLEPKTEAEKKQRYSLCVIISYFYVRIFQIYGALALSVIDEAQTMRATRYSDIARGSVLMAPGLNPYFTRGGAGLFDSRSDRRYDDDDYYRYSDRGRTPYRAPSRPGLGDFSFLDPYLDRSRYDQEMGYRLISSRDRGMTFRISSQQAALATATTGYLFVSSSSVKDRFIFVDMSARNVGSGRVKVTIGKAHIGRTGKTVSLSADDIGMLTYTFRRADDDGEYYLEGDATKDAGEVMTAIGNKVLEYVRGRDSDYTGYVRTDPVTGKEISGVGVMEELRLTKIITNLSRIKPLGYCVARALQLLSSDPLPDKSARSAICNPRFLESTDAKTGTKYMRSGIPLPGEGLDTNPGMLAMSLLFFDVVDTATPKITASNEAVAEFKDFLVQMDGIIGMGSSGSRAANQKKEPTKLSDVKMRACGKAETDIIVPAGTVPEVMGYVRQLFAIQKEHTARVGAILSQLFWIQRDRGTGQLKITIHPNIFGKGMPELNRINALARGALVEYYKHCEFTYRQGVAVVQKSGSAAVPTGASVAKEAAARAAPAAAVPTAKVAPPAVPAAPKSILRKPEQRKL